MRRRCNPSWVVPCHTRSPRRVPGWSRLPRSGPRFPLSMTSRSRCLVWKSAWRSTSSNSVRSSHAKKKVFEKTWLGTAFVKTGNSALFFSRNPAVCGQRLMQPRLAKGHRHMAACNCRQEIYGELILLIPFHTHTAIQCLAHWVYHLPISCHAHTYVADESVPF